ncbi:MAG: DUF2293 domain-containing protein [Desulfobulbaceae bacterium]|nr:DUF2293 domain-containing protein [Desulfobulbaceae bacterium]
MAYQNRTVKPGRTERSVLTDDGKQLDVPEGWALLPPGDGPLTKLVKAKGPTWLVRVKFKKRFISKGIWAKDEHILAAKNELEAKRSAPGYAKKRQQELARKEKKHQEYVQNFYVEVLDFLDFHFRYTSLAKQLARSVTELATPVGSGTVARTERIPLEDRARSAVIAWMRHQTTGYDRMAIARVKGRRREVRRELASRSVGLLQLYREGKDIPSSCPLQRALTGEKQD